MLSAIFLSRFVRLSGIAISAVFPITEGGGETSSALAADDDDDGDDDDDDDADADADDDDDDDELTSELSSESDPLVDMALVCSKFGGSLSKSSGSDFFGTTVRVDRGDPEDANMSNLCIRELFSGIGLGDMEMGVVGVVGVTGVT